MIEVTNEREESPFRKCKEHNEYFVVGNGPHSKHVSYALQWAEVTYYLNKLSTLRNLFAKMREELYL